MGYYISNNEPIENKGAVQITMPSNLSEVPEDKALICEVDNIHFKANALAYSESEFRVFNYPDDHRPKRWFLMDKEQTHRLSGYGK